MSAVSDIVDERRRQVEIEGWTLKHDDAHINGEMASAAAAYASLGSEAVWVWPKAWDWSWLKRTTRRRDLVKAAALIVAEIERLDRIKP